MAKKEVKPVKTQKNPTEEQMLHEKRMQREQQQKMKKQNRRELNGLLLFFLGLYLILCLFEMDAVLIKPCVDLITGMLGQLGRYLLPLATMWAAFVLIRSEGKTVRMRVSCMYGLIVVIVAMVHLLCETFGTFESEFKLVELFKNGQTWKSGGKIGRAHV